MSLSGTFDRKWSQLWRCCVRTLNQEFCTRTFVFHMLPKPISRYAHNTVLQVKECMQYSVSFKVVSKLLLEKGSVSSITLKRVNRYKSITLQRQTSQLMASFCMQNFQHIPIRDVWWMAKVTHKFFYVFIYIFKLSTCFEHTVLVIRRDKLCQYNLW